MPSFQDFSGKDSLNDILKTWQNEAFSLSNTGQNRDDCVNLSDDSCSPIFPRILDVFIIKIPHFFLVCT